MRRLALKLLLVLCAVAVPFGFLASPANADSSTGDFLTRINTLRSSKGLEPLRLDSQLSEFAQGWTDRMAASGTLSHNGDLADAPGRWVKVGENVGVGGAPASLFDAFVASPHHYANLVDPAFTVVGIGVTVTAEGVMWTTHNFEALASTKAPAPSAAPAPAPAPAAAPAPVAKPGAQPVANPVAQPVAAAPKPAAAPARRPTAAPVAEPVAAPVAAAAPQTAAPAPLQTAPVEVAPLEAAPAPQTEIRRVTPPRSAVNEMKIEARQANQVPTATAALPVISQPAERKLPLPLRVARSAVSLITAIV